MNIVPISSYPFVTGINSSGGTTKSAAAGENIPFKDMFASALAAVEQTQAVKDQDTVDLALGMTDDLGAVMANMQKADLAVTMLVQMRNKVLDAYSEIMRINI